MAEVNIQVDPVALQNLINTYGEEKVGEVVQITQTFTQKVQREARDILKQKGRVDTGGLIDSIKQQVNTYNHKVIGQVYTSSKYARFIHEGARHEGATTVPFFVSFKIAPGLRQWAIRKGVIYQKRKDGEKRKTRKAGDAWYMKSKKTGQEYRVNLQKGGMRVHIKETKFLEVPFEKYVDQYLHKVNRVMR